ncbi:phage terminase family protein, partial [Loigolactobacillus coryniformis]|uniref:phage terminase family protein n=1 Tax=Loigolactobacillus coryniformis TaxID=1610 RepID=UPI00201A998B
VLEGSGFRNQFSKRLTNGSEGFDWLNGSTFDLVATMEKSGHGDTLDLGIIDEAFAQTDDRLEQAMEPATITRQSPQIWIISTAGEI